MAVIYGLTHPETGELRYIGWTQNPLQRRLKAHWNSVSSGSQDPVHKWMRKLKSGGLKPVAVILEEVESIDREIHWIRVKRAEGARLLNCTDGGDGFLNPSEEVRKKRSEKAKQQVRTPGEIERWKTINVGRKHSEETKAKLSAIRKGKPKPPGSGDKTRQVHLGCKRSAETCARISEAKKQKRQPLTDQHKANLRAANLGKKHNCTKPRTREHHAKIWASRRANLAARSAQIVMELPNET